VRALFAKNKVRFARVEQLWYRLKLQHWKDACGTGQQGAQLLLW